MTTNGNTALAKAEQPSTADTALETITRPSDGVMALAYMDDRDFVTRIGAMKKGLERQRRIQRELMTGPTEENPAGEDYGIIPGTKKPTLLKPGAEKLCNFYGLVPTFDATITDGDGVTRPHLRVLVTCKLHHTDDNGPVVGVGMGAANSWEKKHRWRGAGRSCPECGSAGTIRRSDFLKDGDKGWYCHAKSGGCGANFHSTDDRITEQQGGRVENPDPFEVENTLVKMSKKRALVDATLAATATSGLFTQDVEEQAESPSGPHGQTGAPARDTRRPPPPPPQQQQRRPQAPQANPPGPAPVQADPAPSESAELRRQFLELLASSKTEEAVQAVLNGVTKFKDRLTAEDRQAMREAGEKSLAAVRAANANPEARAKAAETALKVLAQAESLDAALAFEKAPPLPKHFMTVKDATATNFLKAVEAKKDELARWEVEDLQEKLKYDTMKLSLAAQQVGVSDIDAMTVKQRVNLALHLRAEAQQAGLIGDPEPSAEEYAMAHGTGEGG